MVPQQPQQQQQQQRHGEAEIEKEEVGEVIHRRVSPRNVDAKTILNLHSTVKYPPSWRDARSLSELGYEFSIDDKLVQIASTTSCKATCINCSDAPSNSSCASGTSKKRKAEVSNESASATDCKLGFVFVNQEHYELVGRFVYAEILRRMSAEPLLLQELRLSQRSSKVKETTTDGGLAGGQFLYSPIYHSPGALQATRLLILIPGAGVFAGQWSRKLCVNNSLREGSMLPYLAQATERGWAILILNPNASFIASCDIPVNTRRASYVESIKYEADLPQGGDLPGLNSPFAHMASAFNSAIEDAEASEIMIIAHSFGGTLATNALVSDHCEHLLGSASGTGKSRRLVALALTDSVHSRNRKWSPRVLEFLSKHSRNWVRSKHDLGTVLKARQGVPCSSAGTEDHEMTSESAREEVFAFLQGQLDATSE